jgi:high-affinity Fe2+/Pb2+ permease
MIFMLFFMLLCAILLGYKKWWLEKYQATDQQGVQTDQLVSESSLLGRKRSKFQSQDPKSEMKKNCTMMPAY